MPDCAHITGCQYARMKIGDFGSFIMRCTSLRDLNTIKRQIDSLGDRAKIFPDLPDRRRLIEDQWENIKNDRMVVAPR